MIFCRLEEGDYDKMLRIEPKKLEGLIRDYITHLNVDQKLAYNSVNMYVASISHFYQMNDVTLNWKKLSKFKGKRRLAVEDKPYTKEQIDLLPKIKNMCFLTPELAPTFAAKDDDLVQILGIMTRILDGNGYESHSGAQGHRGYNGR